MHRKPTTTCVEITAATVRLGDVLTIGGQQCEVTDLVSLASGKTKRLVFRTGEALTIHQKTRLQAVRTVGRW